MDIQRYWELIAKTKSGEATPEEQLELRDYRVRQMVDTQVVNGVDALWEMSFEVNGSVSREQAVVAWTELEAKLKVSQQQDSTMKVFRAIRWREHWWKAAALAAVICGVTWIAQPWSTSTDQNVAAKRNIVTTKYGLRSKVQLPDGTTVWLNAGSRMTYDNGYGATNRNLELSGEAYFDVSRNARLPLVISTPNIIVKVLGTVFNVRAYPEDKTTEAALIRGAIEVSFPGRPSERLILRPSQKITLQNVPSGAEVVGFRHSPSSRKEDQPEMSISKVQIDGSDSSVIETSWLKSKFVFRNKTLKDLTTEMERWFNVDIQVEDGGLNEETFTGSFYNGRSVIDALNALQLSYPLKYKVLHNNKVIIISRK